MVLHYSVAITAAQAITQMSKEQLKAFIDQARDDQFIHEQLKAAKTHENVVCIAKEYGYEFTPENITALERKIRAEGLGWFGEYDVTLFVGIDM